MEEGVNNEYYDKNNNSINEDEGEIYRDIT